MQWTAHQDAALRAIGDWLQTSGGPQVFRLFGYAGTGKTTIAKEIMMMPKARSGGRGATLFASFTGKAALMMRRKGCFDASTIHSLIYKLVDAKSEEPTFELNKDSALRSASVLVVDEVSMVDEEVATDLLSFGKKILVIGDPAQLPPVEGAGYFINSKPDAMLTEIHRQASGNPIIRMATEVRQGRALSLGDYGDSRVIRREQLGRTAVMSADQVIVGMNRTRHAVNDKMRGIRWNGAQIDTPMVGDKLICLRNNRKLSIFNGGLWQAFDVGEPRPRDRNVSRLTLLDLDIEEGRTARHIEVGVPNEFWTGNEKEVPAQKRRALQEFAFGYAITAHKSQGSQWDNVVVFDESGVFKEDRDRWLYTALTRAAERITIVKT